MDKIVELLNNFDKLGEKIPALDNVMELVLKVTKLAVQIGPACILILGLIYLFIPPNEANHKAGYRTFFGMGSVGAWRFTQFFAGLIMTFSGLSLHSDAKAAVAEFSLANTDGMLETAFSLIKTQVIHVVAIYVFMWVFTALMFNIRGNLRFKFLRGTLFDKLLFDENPLRLLIKVFSGKDEPAPKRKRPNPVATRNTPELETVEEPEAETTYERQGEQVITANDIVIEDL